jgi:hypothetical protein
MGEKAKVKPVLFELEEDIFWAFKAEVAKERKTMREVLVSLIRKYLEERGLKI